MFIHIIKKPFNYIRLFNVIFHDTNLIHGFCNVNMGAMDHNVYCGGFINRGFCSLEPGTTKMLPDFRNLAREHFEDEAKQALYGSGLNYAFGLDHTGRRLSRQGFIDCMREHCGSERAHLELATDENQLFLILAGYIEPAERTQPAVPAPASTVVPTLTSTVMPTPMVVPTPTSTVVPTPTSTVVCPTTSAVPQTPVDLHPYRRAIATSGPLQTLQGPYRTLQQGNQLVRVRSDAQLVPASTTAIMCRYCKKVGHSIEECWKRPRR